VGGRRHGPAGDGVVPRQADDRRQIQLWPQGKLLVRVEPVGQVGLGAGSPPRTGSCCDQRRARAAHRAAPGPAHRPVSRRATVGASSPCAPRARVASRHRPLPLEEAGDHRETLAVGVRPDPQVTVGTPAAPGRQSLRRTPAQRRPARTDPEVHQVLVVRQAVLRAVLTHRGHHHPVPELHPRSVNGGTASSAYDPPSIRSATAALPATVARRSDAQHIRVRRAGPLRACRKG
jgi:hypothetical protein